MILRTDNLVKRYRSRTVVNHVSIQVGQGEIVGLLGPNGAGKTTTFYMTVGHHQVPRLHACSCRYRLPSAGGLYLP